MVNRSVPFARLWVATAATSVRGRGDSWSMDWLDCIRVTVVERQKSERLNWRREFCRVHGSSHRMVRRIGVPQAGGTCRDQSHDGGAGLEASWPETSPAGTLYDIQ